MLNFIQKNFIKINLNKNDFNEDVQIIMIFVRRSLKNYIFLQVLKWHMQRREMNV